MSDVIKARITVSFVIILVILCNLFLWSWLVNADDEWVSPTGNSDPESSWTNESNAYNDNTSNYAVETIPKGEWGNPLILTIDSMWCSKVRVYSDGQADITNMRVYVEYDSAWDKIYDGAAEKGEYVEYSIGSVEEVSGIKLEYYNDSSYLSSQARVSDSDFWLCSEPESNPDDISLSPATDTNYVCTNHTFTATVTEDSSPLPDISVTWDLTGVGEILTSSNTTDESGEATATITSSSPGNSTVECYVTDNSSITDTAVKTWENYPITHLEVSPSSDTNYVGTNHTLNATVTNSISQPVSGANVTWNITGVGDIVDSTTTTDGNGAVNCIISSESDGLSTVCCYLAINASIYDCGNKTWEEVPITPTWATLLPNTGDHCITYNHTWTLTIYGSDNNPYTSANVTWNLTGVGEILDNDTTTGANGTAQCIVTSTTPGETTMQGYCTEYPDAEDSATHTWTAITPSAISVNPLWFNQTLGSNQTVIAIVYGCGGTLPGTNVTWNITGVGEILTSDNVTGSDGTAYCTLTSFEQGDCDVYCTATNTSYTDYSNGLWYTDIVESDTFIPWWFFVILAASLFAAWYTKSFILGFLAVAACGTGIWWMGDSGWSSTIIVFVRVILFCLIGFIIYWMITEGSIFGNESSEENYED